MIKKIIKENKWYLLWIILTITILTILMKSSFSDTVMIIDNKIIKIMSNIVYDSLTSIFKIITIFGDLYIPIIIIVCIFIFLKNKWYFYLLTSGYAFSGIITYVSKFLTGRARPVSALIDIPKSFSFPSGHTLTSLVFYILLCYLIVCNKDKKTKIISMIFVTIFVLLIAISRIYLGVHYFSDVIGGILIGVPCILFIINVIKKNFKEKLL